MSIDRFTSRRPTSIVVRYGVGLCALLFLCRIAWLALATAIADHKAISDPKAALAWRAETSLALLSLAQEHFVRATFTPLRDRPEESVLSKRVDEKALMLDAGFSLHPAHAESVLMERAGRPAVGNMSSIARWIDLESGKIHYARAVAKVADVAHRVDLTEIFATKAQGVQSSPLAIRYAAERFAGSLGNRSLEAARALGRQSLVADPLRHGALVLLSDIAARGGERERSIALMRLAGSRSFRDVVSQSRLIDIEISEGDYFGAVARADALMRAGGKFRALVREFLTTAAMDNRGYSALSEFLAGSPPWRQSIFQSLGAYGQADSGLRLLSELAEKKGALQPGDLAPVLQLLVRQNRTVDAYLAWIGFSSDKKRAKAGLLFDGSFTEEPSDIPFEWNLHEVPKGSIGFLAGSSSGGERMLRVEFVGEREPKLAAYQMLALSAGRYRLSVQAMSDGLRVAHGVVWRISCPDGPLAETEPVRGSTAWREISVDFEMPADRCEFPMLRLALKAKLRPELVANGSAFFRKMQLVRLPAPRTDRREAKVLN